MIRPSLQKAIERALDSHLFLGRSDFVLHERKNEDNEACLVVAYRADRKFCFLVTVKSDQDFSGESTFNVIAVPGREVFTETFALKGRTALLAQLKAWQKRLHEDVGVFPIDRQFQAHIRRIGRMEACLGLSRKPIEEGTVDSFLVELATWEEMLQEFIRAFQAMHQSGLVWYLRARSNEIRKLQEDLQGRDSQLRWELDQMASATRENTESALMLLEELEAEKICLLESGLIGMREVFERDSKRLDEIRDRIASTADVTSAEEWKTFKDRVHHAPDTLMAYCNDEHIKAFKRHLVAGTMMRKQYDEDPV